MAAATLSVQSAGLTDVGHRRQNNEDAFITDPILGLYAVADGMGGHAGGEVAATMAIDMLRRAVDAAPEPAFVHDPSVHNRAELLGWMAALVSEISGAIYTRAQEQPELRGMGCTLDFALVRGGGLFLAHVGDGRVYALRDGALRTLTEDHTFAQLVATQGTSLLGKLLNIPRNALTRALGVHPIVQADTTFHELQKGDVLLLCSDGLHDLVDAEGIRARLSGDPSRAATALVDAALDAGGRDNVTAVVLSVDESTFGRPVIIGADATLALLARTSLFGALTPGELLRVQKLARAREVPAGEVLMVQDEPIEAMALVLSGTLSLWRDGQRLGQFEPGDPFGEWALVGQRADITVRAETAGMLLELPAPEIQSFISTDPTIAAKLALSTLARFSQRMRQLATALARARSEAAAQGRAEPGGGQDTE